MWSVGLFDLGLSEEEFWRITPRMYMALSRRLEKRRQMELHDLASILAAIYNTIPRKDKKIFRAEDFLPKKKRNQKPEEQLKVSRAINLMLGGKNG